jgi:2-keto-4-pentenoate hydratase|eukprot:COSAG01_NODE_92_length_27199_cov_100.594649_9_plen_378_part_00
MARAQCATTSEDEAESGGQLDAESLRGIGIFLLARREAGAPVRDPAALPHLPGLADVYAVHAGMAATSSTLGRHVGWKCGACAPEAQAGLGLREPFRAPLFEGRVKLEERPTLDPRSHMLCLEAEFAFIMARGLPPRGAEEGAYSAEEVWGAVRLVVPAIEACATRWDGAALARSSPLQRLADAGMNELCALGEAVEVGNCRRDLDRTRVRFRVNGEEVCEGTGANVLGHPINTLVWLANHLVAEGVSTESSSYGGGSIHGLREGDLVMSGAALVLPAEHVRPGDIVTAEFEGLGRAELSVSVVHGDSPAPTATTATNAAHAQPAPARLSSAEWRQLCAEARTTGVEVPVVWPWSGARERQLRRQLEQQPSPPRAKL